VLARATDRPFAAWVKLVTVCPGPEPVTRPVIVGGGLVPCRLMLAVNPAVVVVVAVPLSVEPGPAVTVWCVWMLVVLTIALALAILGLVVAVTATKAPGPVAWP